MCMKGMRYFLLWIDFNFGVGSDSVDTKEWDVITSFTVFVDSFVTTFLLLLAICLYFWICIEYS